MSIKIVSTKPYSGQEPGTSGLRKATKVFQQENYVQNFIQSIFNYLGSDLKGSTLVVGGDGRYLVKETVHTIIQMSAANGVSKLLVGENGILSTPAESHIIRKYKAIGGIILTASHNPGGPDNDFGIKYNITNGGAAPSNVTNKIAEISRTISEYKIVDGLKCPIDEVGSYDFSVESSKFTVQIIDPIKDYAELMKEIFDFGAIKSFLSGGKFKLMIDCMHGVSGPYAKAIFENELGAAPGSVINCVPLEDFGGGHPDPNLTYAADLVNAMSKGEHDLGAAFDGDADRNMILGRNAFFVTPSDSLAILADNLECIPYFIKNGVKGFARSMPTAAAVDRVGNKKNKKVHEVPTGWKYFGNLMDMGEISICGEESFGTGSDHIREKDGVWAVVAWLSVLANKKKGVEELVVDFWKTYGRNYTIRYDYETVDSDGANKMMAYLESIFKDIVGKKFTSDNYTVKMADNFCYTDPLDKSVAKNQGVRIIFTDGSRVVYRLSGTGSTGATIRIYLEKYEASADKVTTDRIKALDTLSQAALEISKIQEFTGRDKPTVIT